MNLFKSLTLILMVMLGSVQVVKAAFPETYYPDGTRPRLWLTSERVSFFQQSMNSNSDRWQAFKELCDSLIDSEQANDPWDLDINPQTYTAPLALMYRLTLDARYADRALELVDAAPATIHGYANPDHHNFEYLGLAYDWLHGYSGMTETKKSAFRLKMKSVSDEFWEENINASGTDSDKNIITGFVHLILGAAMYGDDSDAVSILDRAWTGWEEGYGYAESISNRDMIKSALGGFYFTGMAYFPGTDAIGMSGHWQTFSTAYGYDINTLYPDLKPFWANIIRAVIHLTEPTRGRIYHYGSWQDPNTLPDQPWMRRMVTTAVYLADQAGFTQEASLGRGYADTVDIGYFADPFMEFMFDTSGSTTSPYDGSQPLIYFGDEPDFISFRTNWTADATWGLFIGDGSIPFDHQAPDHGSFVLWRGDDYLTKGARSYDSMTHGDFFNTLSIENRCMVNEFDCSGTANFNAEKGAQMTRVRTQEGSLPFVYSMIEADGQWNENPDEWEPVMNVKSYRRHFFWSDDYVVVFDRLRGNKPVWSKYRLRAMSEPLINGDTVTQLSANGKHKLMQRTLEPSDVTIHKLDESILWQNEEDWVVPLEERKWQSVIEFSSSESQNILNVLQMGPASMTSFDTLEHIDTTENSGTRIGNWVVLFAQEESLLKSVSYSVSNSTAGMWHLIADMSPGEYEIRVKNQSAGMVTVKDQDNTALFETDKVMNLMDVSLSPAGESAAAALMSVFYLLLDK